MESKIFSCMLLAMINLGYIVHNSAYDHTYSLIPSNAASLVILPLSVFKPC